jgi:hypothetical protein
MAGAQAPDQKAAADKAAAEALAEREAAEAAALSTVETVTRLEVIGAAVVLGTSDGSERYLYRGAVVARSAFTKASITHAIDLGLVAEVETLVLVTE